VDDMKTVQAFQSERTGKNYRNAKDALTDEFRAMQKELAIVVGLIPSVTVPSTKDQFARCRQMLTALEAKQQEILGLTTFTQARQPATGNVIQLRKAA
jgi:hypothetical protein